MAVKRPIVHYAGLTAILLLGAALRFWQLDSKPLWLDEVITALISLGHSYQDVPLDTFFPLTAIDQIFVFQPGVSCAQITQTVITESVHPPLFFCLLYRWLDWLRPNMQQWVWALRSLPALFGVGAIGAIYGLNRIAFTPATGLMAAALMAVSPFAVYLSQEARHYTLPMLLISLSLTILVRLQQGIEQQTRSRPWWLIWVVISAIGLYVHYFMALAVVAQLLALGSWMSWQRHQTHLRHWLEMGGAIALLGLTYVPWLPTMLHHFSRPETDWLRPHDPGWLDRIAPLYQTVVGWVLMLIALPIEAQPLAIALPAAVLIAGFVVGLTPHLYRGVKQRWQEPSSRSPLLLLAGFTGYVLLQFWAIVYLLDKDITAVPRYNFVYYPGMAALLGAVLGSPYPAGKKAISRWFRWRVQAIVVCVGIVSSLIVGYGLAFQKGYYPHRIASNMYLAPSTPLAVAMSYESLQDVALGLSVALELHQQYPVITDETPFRFAFLQRHTSYRQVWQDLASLPQPLPLPLNLWIAAPGLRAKQFPEQLRLSQPTGDRPKARCAIDRAHYHRIGFPYQLYRCRP
ncbi:glycosyltransferase family 39 protein [Oculatella sp. LEGE 06141]|uniref:glycosyltransferase family 39 protein n=1 Tax=Oculatella sp. LEGE 06141 TaxID=1828648 RepID=UPI00187E28CB|nr:glycosyltransferase family 39 protein [Oculatella sp. LEGE 06141]MBE9182832.1 glycosyltransferase family 39 protein [Oculatella sp. LEGE 06141]